MKVCEIFRSIQGESSFAGLPCAFIRLSGCNLRCAYCDTVYARDEGVELSEEEIINELSLIGCGLVEITGGEPLVQEGALHLIERLCNDGLTVLLETNGSLSIKDVDRRAVIILDIKTPGSGMTAEMDLMNLDYIKPSDEVKFVLVDRADYEWARDFIARHALLGRCKVLLSPAFGVLDAAELCGWMLRDRLEARLNLQLHKYIFGPDKRGV
ncbi:MAG: radical SAM protein [Thermodesulfovibrionales bacterium]